MAKNFASLYTSVNDAIALEQKFFVKEEVTRGTIITPTGTDFIYTLSGGSINFTQPIESSPHRSGRHHNNHIKQKTETSWTMPMFFNIDSTLGAASTSEIDAAARVLYKSMFGKEDTGGGSPVYTSGTDPNTTFTLFQNLDQVAIQAIGAFVESANMTFPGDGQAQVEFAGNAKTAYTVGIGLTQINNNGGNTVTVQSGEGELFPAGALVMLVEADGTTRSADTPDGSPRTVVSVAGDVVTLDGAALADADGSLADIYLAYYEPVTPSAIDDPQTGLEGSVTIVNLPALNCVRSATINCVNNHELYNFCFGEEGLAGPLFTPGGRLDVNVTLELNLNRNLAAFINNFRNNNFDGEDITLVLGPAAGRRLQLEIPKAKFSVPEIAVPDTGSIPISFTGLAYQTALDAADEITASFL